MNPKEVKEILENEREKAKKRNEDNNVLIAYDFALRAVDIIDMMWSLGK